jgi:hypothetical protein
MMKQITYIMLSLSTVVSAQAYELSTMTLTYFDRDGEAPRRTSTSCNVVADCYSYSYQGIGTDIFSLSALIPITPCFRMVHGSGKTSAAPESVEIPCLMVRPPWATP